MRLGAFLFRVSSDPSGDSQIIDKAVREAKLVEDEGMDAIFLTETGIRGVSIRFRSGPIPAAFSARGLTLFMKEIAPRIRTSESVAA